jgi:sulfur carrier protein ThiS adenylyltransferase
MISRQELSRAFDSRFPPQMRDRLQAGRVAVAGLGGLGSNIAVMLARSGVGHLFLVDFDTVDTTNLNRQHYFIDHLGMKKTDAIQSILEKINPYLDVETRCVRVTPDNLADLFSAWPIVCEAFDQPDQKAMLVQGLLTSCPNTAVISGNGMAGFGDANGIHTEKRLSRLYVCGDGTTDVGQGIGLMAPRVAICAGHEANKAIQLIMQD